MNFRFKLAAAALAATCFAGAHADPFYLDIGGTGITPNTSNPNQVKNATCGLTSNPNTCTSMYTQFTFTYDSRTVITTPSGGIAVGDATTTNAGLAVGNWDTNQLTAFKPFNANASQGYATNWLLSFKITGLNGVVTNTSGPAPFISYGPGAKLEMYVGTGLDANGIPTSTTHFMDIDITGGQTDGTGTALLGQVDFTGLSSVFGNLFHSGAYSCGGSSGFYDIWANCGGGASLMLNFNFIGHFDTDLTEVTVTPAPDGSSVTIAGNHDGSATFAIPEPASVGLVGLGLVAAAGISRRRKQQA